MNLFVNDVLVEILDHRHKPNKGDFNTVINAQNEPIRLSKLLHRVLIKHVQPEDIDSLLDLLDTTSHPGLISLALIVEDYDQVKKFLKKKFKIIKAAGGLVRKGEKILMIYRLKKWDLPKGKLENEEKQKAAAQREVEEECNIEVKTHSKICTTWHTYTMKRKKILKKTAWYTMDVVNHSKMKPQIEEDIEEVRWMAPKEVYHALQHSYRSIEFVFDSYFQKEKTEI